MTNQTDYRHNKRDKAQVYGWELEMLPVLGPGYKLHNRSRLLTIEQVNEIRRLRFENGGVTLANLAKRFNVCITHVSKICRGASWI